MTYLGWEPDGKRGWYYLPHEGAGTWELCLRAPTERPWRQVSGNCGQKYYKRADCITSPNYPQVYGNNEWCKFEIPLSWQNASEQYRIWLVEFDIQWWYDWFTFDQFTPNQTWVSGDASVNPDIKTDLESAIPTQSVEFETDPLVVKQGFFVCAWPGIYDYLYETPPSR
eukprot:3231702-Amphidinium_carterae.1